MLNSDFEMPSLIVVADTSPSAPPLDLKISSYVCNQSTILKHIIDISM